MSARTAGACLSGHTRPNPCRAFPKMMDLPEFGDISLLADCQRIEDIL